MNTNIKAFITTKVFYRFSILFNYLHEQKCRCHAHTDIIKVSVYLNLLNPLVKISLSLPVFAPPGSTSVDQIKSQKHFWVPLMSTDYLPKLHLAACTHLISKSDISRQVRT